MDGIQFDFTNYELNKDYNQYARMTTFNGQAVLIGIVSQHNGDFATWANKYVEVFDEDENEWILKDPNKFTEDMNWSAQYALVPLKDKLLHLGGNDIGEDDVKYHNYLGFYLDTEFSKWTKLANRGMIVSGKQETG